jgi:hypothetical protein
LKVSHGYEVKEGRDPMVSLIEKVMDEFAQVTAPGAYLVDFLPFRESPFGRSYPGADEIAVQSSIFLTGFPA